MKTGFLTERWILLPIGFQFDRTRGFFPSAEPQPWALNNGLALYLNVLGGWAVLGRDGKLFFGN